MAKVGSVDCVGFLVEGASVFFWWMRLDLVFLVGRSTSVGVLWGVCCLIMFLAASLLMHGVVFLSCYLFGIGYPAL